jgi:hypothetical protein
VQSLRTAVDAKLRTLALDFRAHRLHTRRTELRTLQLRVHHTFTPPVAAVGEDADAPTTPGAPGRWTLHLQAVDASDASATPVVRSLGWSPMLMRMLTRALSLWSQ